ncbi:OmpA family protein [Paracoccus spongiarum]|uniref:OmpA family protein n=1 Tax=Paracoccus spongiarum TaxID=3064387 RepID=A0ABT9JC24_9RHOB|nr:OmpA family protein [Paracoccus sp. 2205BS29-5]MDP5307358.1 OmpA family protein [Paracoccus sp. 2205BS29-5]
MRRIIHNTTALAACLSLMAPHLALAQTAAPEDAPQAQAEAAPDPAAAETAAPAETCEDGSTPPCAAAAEASDAGQSEAEAGDDQAATEAEAAPAAQAPADQAAQPPVSETVPSDAATSQPADQPEAEPKAAEAGTPAVEPAEAPEEMTGDQQASDETTTAEPEAAAGADADAGLEAQPAPPAEPDMDTDALADALAAEQAKAADAEAPDAMPQADDAQPAAEAGTTPAAKRMRKGGTAKGETQAAEAEAPTPSADPAPAAADPASDADALADALAREAETQDGQAATDEAASQEAGAAPAKGGPDTATRAPEEGATQTDSAREAAQATDAPAAAALSDEAAPEGEVSEVQITEDNSRSSSEDFATSLRDALGAQGGQSQAAEAQAAGDDGDDDRRDLTRALLLGLGGIAVGAMLTNNRQVALSAPDRVVVTRPDGSQQIIKDEVALLRQPGSTVTTENFDDGSSRTIVTRADGSKVVTIRDADLRVLRRTLVAADGSTVPLIDDTSAAEPVDIASLPAPAPATVNGQMDEDALRAALLRESAADRRFTLAQIRNIPQVRALVAPVEIEAITFDTGSAAINPDQAQQLSTLGKVIREAVQANPREVFLIEGHTDTVGSDAANLALSDRRAESVALALTEYFDVPPENMVVEGYGEQFLKLRQEGDVRENRRASVRRISDLLQTAAR